MPTFLDITGLEDEESEINKEMLSLFFNGKLKEGEDFNSVRQFYFNNEQDIHTLRQFYNKRSENAQVDRIIVVCTAKRTPPLPESLLRAIRDTAKKGSRHTPPLSDSLLRAIRDTTKKGSRGNVNSYVRYYQLTCQRHFMLAYIFCNISKGKQKLF